MKSPLLVLVLAFALLVPICLAAETSADSKITLEAEKAVSIGVPLKKVADKTASGGGYVLSPWDPMSKALPGRALYTFTVKKPGTYFLWARTFWTQGQGNSIKVAVNDSYANAKILGEDGTYNSWHWVGGRARFALKAGENKLQLTCPETGVRIDSFLFSQDQAPNGPHRPVQQ